MTSDSPPSRAERGAQVVDKLNAGKPQQALENMRETFPFLAEATQSYALRQFRF